MDATVSLRSENIKEVNVTTPEEEPNLKGSHGSYEVSQGSGMRYNKGESSRYNELVAQVPLKDRVISLPVSTLDRMEKNLTEVFQRERLNNILLGMGILQSTVIAFVGFKNAFQSLLNKIHDNTLLSILQKCINELKQINREQTKVATHEFSWLVTNEDSLMTNTRMLFEHCIKVLEEMLPLLKIRTIETRSYEPVKQVFGWPFWRQHSHQIGVFNKALSRLLKELLEKDPDNLTYLEILCFQETVDYILSCFAQNQCPIKKNIESIYTKSGFTVFDGFSNPFETEDIKTEVSGPQKEISNFEDWTFHIWKGGS